MKTDVIIVGAGPTGLALACQLIRYGIDFIILDSKETTTPYSKAIGVQARTLEIYDQIGLADSIISQGNISEKVRFVEGGEVRGEVDLKHIGEGMSPYPFLLIAEQGKHEKLLYDYLKAHGKDVWWQSAITNIKQDEAGVTATFKNSGGEVGTIEAKFLVGCDGAKSIVRHQLGLNFEGSTFERLFYVADVQVKWNYPHDSLYICLAQNSLTAFFPMVGENRFRIVGTFPENENRREGELLYEDIEKQIAKDTELKLDISDVNWFSTYKVHSRRVNKFSEGRCFLAGDSAHIHTPAGAQGMNTGIQDGYNLAWKLALVLRGRASIGLLDTYNEERSANAKRLLQTTDRIFDLGASDEWFTAFVRTKILPYIANAVLHLDSVKRYIFPLVSQIGINYRKSSLSEENGFFSIKAGDRMPHFEFEGVSIYERLKEPKFHLLTFFDGANKPLTTAANFPENFIDFHEFPLYPNIAEIFGAKQTFSVLLRPDNYIGLISTENSATILAEYFRIKFGLNFSNP
jgi:2-polyprenyl-6-methoxyphenol hydroxylase-like FAD-dependent oxidoreductase